MLNLIFTTPTTEDIQHYIRLYGGDNLLKGRIKIVATDDDGHTAELFPFKNEVERLGEEYIRSHAVMKCSKSLGLWYLEYSQNDYYNDTERNPEKVIKVKFCKDETNTDREIYKDIDTGCCFHRIDFYPRENFAKWYVYDNTPEDGIEARPNIIFEHNGEREKVRYDDRNGVAAYSDTYNRNFNPAVNN